MFANANSSDFTSVENILTHCLFIKLDWRMLCPAVNHLYYSNIISKKDSAWKPNQPKMTLV